MSPYTQSQVTGSRVMPCHTRLVNSYPTQHPFPALLWMPQQPHPAGLNCAVVSGLGSPAEGSHRKPIWLGWHTYLMCNLSLPSLSRTRV